MHRNKLLTETGLDSMDYVVLLHALEVALGRAVPLEWLQSSHTWGDFLDKLAHAKDSAPEVACANSQCESDYARFVNPYLAQKLQQLRMNKSFVRGDGCFLWDDQGQRTIDFTSQYGALPFGHHPACIWDALMALREDAEPMYAQPSLLPSAGRLARRLLDLAPSGMTSVTFCNSGTEAVEAALKMARSATGRKGILSTHMGFHGKTFGALSATGKADYQVHFGLPLPGFHRIPFGDASALARALEAQPHEFAAFIVEPIQGEGGVTVPPAGYLTEVQQICRTHGVLMIVDEVQTGFGRTGHLLACEHEGIRPDIITLAKALGGGLVPVGAVLANDRAYGEKFALKHSSTFAGGALAARAGLATLDALLKDDGAILRNVNAVGEHLRKGLERLRATFPETISHISGRGLMLAIHFHPGRDIEPYSLLGIALQEKEAAQLVAAHLLNVEHVRLAPTLNGGNALRVQPPLNVTAELCDEVLSALERTVRVLSARNTGAFFQGMLHGGSALSPQVVSPQLRAPALQAAQASRFAFLLHPLDDASYVDYDTTLGVLSEEDRRELASSMNGLLDPFISSSARITSANGTQVDGDFIMLSHTAAQLRALPRKEALTVLRQGLNLARQRGAQLVGLGAYTSIVSGGGELLADSDLPLTSGNTYTVVAAMQAIQAVWSRTGWDWEGSSAAVVGAAGAIGACLATRLARHVERLILVGNPAHDAAIGREKLMGVVHVLAASLNAPDTDPSAWPPNSVAAQLHRALQQTGGHIQNACHMLEGKGALLLAGTPALTALADVVVTATSHPESSVRSAHLRRGAVVCDISRPRSIDAALQMARPDVLVIDGGVVALPGGEHVGPYGLPEGTAYACMGETMLMALSGQHRHASLGGRLDPREVDLLTQLSQTHGFAADALFSFGEPVSDADLKRWQQARSGSKLAAIQCAATPGEAVS